MEIDRRDFVKKLNVYKNTSWYNYRYLACVFYFILVKYIAYAQVLFACSYTYQKLTIKNPKREVITTVECGAFALLDTCMTISLDNKKTSLRIPYENIARFQILPGYILEAIIIGTYDSDSNAIATKLDFFRISMKSVDVIQCYVKLKQFIDYHIHFNMFDLKIVEIYDVLKKIE